MIGRDKVGRLRVFDWSNFDPILYSPTIAFFCHVNVVVVIVAVVVVRWCVFFSSPPTFHISYISLSVFIALGFILLVDSNRSFEPVVAPLPRGLLAFFYFSFK